MNERPFMILSTGAAEHGHAGLQPAVATPGVQVEDIPFIRILPATDDHRRYRVRALARQRRVAIFTSANAVRAVTTLMETKPAWTIYCIGNTTRKTAALFFGEAAIAATAPDAGTLADQVIRDQIREAVFFCGAQRLDVLPEKLRKNAVILEELVVYETIQEPVKLEKKFDAILFFSPSAVHAFFSLNAAPSGAILFALGSTTAEALRKYADNEIIMASSPDKKTILQMAISYGQSHPVT